MVLRCASAEALGEIGDNRAIEPLIRISQQRFREKWPVRRCAVNALGNFRVPRSSQALNDTISSFFEKKWVKTAARASLKKIQEERYK
ncbi:MAG: HEAT repeat domain-containing protein [Nitrospirae bacterium]|nr:HEAT repeat domain-containing protein [Nitrospirota bacterium]